MYSKNIKFYRKYILLYKKRQMSAIITQQSTKDQAAIDAAAQVTPNGYRLPEIKTLQHAAKLSIIEDKPIMLDYWTTSLDKTVLIGVKDTQEKLLVKSEEEYTSPISKIYKVGKEYIIVTENTIYILSADTPVR